MTARSRRDDARRLPPTFPPQHAAAWVAGRRFGVPARMVAEATSRRRAGDWQGACVAARVDVRFTPQTLTDEYGSETAALITDDLMHLAPDLVRWHLPRHLASGTGELAPSLSVVLATYRGVGEPELALTITTPVRSSRPQRLSLEVKPTPQPREPHRCPVWNRFADRFVERWDLARHLWDDRHTSDLRRWVGGGDRIPFHAVDGRLLDPAEWPTDQPDGTDRVALTEWCVIAWDRDLVEEAWDAVGGWFVRDHPKGLVRYVNMADAYSWKTRRLPCATPVVAAALDEHDAFRLISNPTTRYDPGASILVKRAESGIFIWHDDTDDEWDDDETESPAEHDSNSVLQAPPSWCGRSADLDLLRFRKITPMQLHPLVRSALLPGFEGDERYGPSTEDDLLDTVPVRCRGQWHSVDWRDNRLTAVAHPPKDEQREAVLGALGGEKRGCFRVTQAWNNTTLADVGRRGRRCERPESWLPKHLQRIRSRLLRAVSHGDVDEVTRLLRSGVDLRHIRDHHGSTLLHRAACVDLPDLVTILIAGGVSINDTDTRGRTPLHQVLIDGAPAPLVRRLIDAGADITAVDNFGMRPVHVMCSTDAATILPWLLAPGEEVPNGPHGFTPIVLALRVDSPTEVIAALLAAGVDPNRDSHIYRRMNLAKFLENKCRDDLTELMRPHLR